MLATGGVKVLATVNNGGTDPDILASNDNLGGGGGGGIP